MDREAVAYPYFSATTITGRAYPGRNNARIILTYHSGVKLQKNDNYLLNAVKQPGIHRKQSVGHRPVKVLRI